MDAFRTIYLPEPYIFCLDPTDGHCKTVIDKFFSFIWTERRSEAGEMEITAPEDVYWSDLVSKGDYIQFKGSSVSQFFGDLGLGENVQHDRPGRYTMIVESKYTKFEADKGYTTYVKGRSLDCLLERRINLGIVDKHDTPATEQSIQPLSYRDRLRDGYLFGVQGSGNNYDHLDQIKADEDRKWAYYGLSFVANYNEENRIINTFDIPYVIENLVSDSINAPNRTWEDTNGARLILDLVRYNCGDMAHYNRQFPNFYVRGAHNENPDTREREYSDYINSLGVGPVRETIDGKFENVYDLITEWLPKLCKYSAGKIANWPTDSDGRPLEPDYSNWKDWEGTTYSISETDLGMRLVGWMEGTPNEDKDGSVFKMGFELYKGKDLTVDGPNKSFRPVIYSRDMDNLISMNMLDGEANYKNLIYYDTGYDYTPDDIYSRQKEIEALEKEKDLLDIKDDKEREKKEKEINDKIEKLNEEINKLEKDYDKRGFRMPYVSVIDRRQMKQHAMGTAVVARYAKGLERREMYVDDELPFVTAAAPKDDNQTPEWQGRPFLKYRYTIRHDPPEGQENAKPTYEDKYLAIDWDYNSNLSINNISKTTFADPDNSREDDVEAELNYNAVYQPKRDYDIGDLVTIMGIRHNEITRVGRVDEMAYSIDSSGYTIVPTFTVLPVEDDVQ